MKIAIYKAPDDLMYYVQLGNEFTKESAKSFIESIDGCHVLFYGRPTEACMDKIYNTGATLADPIDFFEWKENQAYRDASFRLI